MANIVILFLFLAALIGFVIYGLTIYVMDRMKPSNKELVDELYSRNVISKDEYQRTVEIAIKKENEK